MLEYIVFYRTLVAELKHEERKLIIFEEILKFYHVRAVDLLDCILFHEKVVVDFLMLPFDKQLFVDYFHGINLTVL